MRRHRLRAAWLLLLDIAVLIVGSGAGCLHAAEPDHATAPQPNVLLMVVDDLGGGDLRSFHPPAPVDTPNINALAAGGMRFSRFYTDSTCSASRAALLTGRHPARLGFHPVARGIAPEIITLPEWLREQGYRTHHVGKWHVGELDVSAWPAAQGFDTSFGFLNQWFLQGPDGSGKPLLRPPVYFDPWLQDERGRWRQYSGYLPDILTQHAAELIQRESSAGRPWLLFYATPLVHGPLHAPPGTDSGASDDQKYAAMLRHLDSDVGRLLAALDQSGQRDNTVIVFLSDNGAPAKREGSNAPFGGGKGHYQEGSVRTPMIWVDPQRVLPGSLDERAVTLMDILPTLAGRLGIAAPAGLDGVDVHALSSYDSLSKRFLYWLTRDSYSAMAPDKTYRLTENWVFREFQGHDWSLILSQGTEYSAWQYWLRSVDRIQLQRAFRTWLEGVSETELIKELLPQGGYRLSGNDFLRTPLREWDFYIPLIVRAADREQFIAGQKGVWSLHYDTQRQMLRVHMHGHDWQQPLALPASRCVVLGLNADLYDRYTNTDASRYPSELRLSVNGKEVSRTAWQLDSMAGLAIESPTWIGTPWSGNSVAEHAWQGDLSAPRLFHRASIVGDWPFLIDEAALQQVLCAEMIQSVDEKSVP